MSHEMATWLNRIGIILGFFSFWFAAPEFIGEKRLKSWEESLAKLTGKIPILTAGFFALLGYMILLAAGTSVVFLIGYLSSSIPDWIPGMPDMPSWLFGDVCGVLIFGVILGGGYFLYNYFSSLNRRIKHMILRAVSAFANDSRQRQRSLFLGAFLFIISTVLQFLATFESAK
jgi:hypothetical protein